MVYKYIKNYCQLKKDEIINNIKLIIEFVTGLSFVLFLLFSMFLTSLAAYNWIIGNKAKQYYSLNQVENKLDRILLMVEGVK